MSRRNQVRGLAASTMAVLAVTLPACGGGGKSSSTTTSAAGVTLPAAFIAKVDAVCANGVQRLNAHGKFPYQQFDPLHPNTALLPKVGAFFRPNIAIDQSVVTQLKALGEPQSGAAQWNAMRALAIASVANAARQVQTALASNASAFVQTVNTVGRLHNQISAKATAAGFTSSSPCGQVF